MKIVTSVVNNPSFIEIQYATIKKFVEHDSEFIVFNDAKDFPDFTNGGDISLKSKIEEVCKKLNITYINIPNNHHKEYSRYKDCCQAACLRTEDSLRYILEYQKKYPDLYLGIDSDMFFINYFNINRYKAYHAAIVPQYRNVKKEVKYFWNGLYYFDFLKLTNQSLLNWDGNAELSCDSGGMMKDWLAIQDSKNLYQIDHLISLNWDENNAPQFVKNNIKLMNLLKEDPRNKNKKIYSEIYDNTFLHYRAGGNWNGEGINFHLYMSQQLKDILI